jgi:RNA-directed DNA polymerase
VRVPAATVEATTRKRVLGFRSRGRELSVDSECVGRGLSPEKVYVAGADAFGEAEGDISETNRRAKPGASVSAIPPGSRNAARTQGLPRNLGDLALRREANAMREGRPKRISGTREVGAPQYERRRGGTDPTGPHRAKGGAGRSDPNEGTMGETQRSPTISAKLERIAELARRHSPMTTLAHHIDVEWLHEAYRRTRKDGAPGVDGRTAEQYEAELEGNLRSLLERARSGMYRAPPVRRAQIPKGDGSQRRPIGIPTIEDKVLQRAVVMVLEPIYEQLFHDFSYGFRPKRSAHQACEALWQATMRMQGGWVLEADIKGFFDTLDHGQLREILHQRVRDGVILRLIGKWLNAGVLDGLELSHPEAGTPQGGVISPLLANIYLHEVLDEWYVRDVQPRLAGRAALVRYADDFVFVFERKEDAERVLDVLPKRFGKYGLTLHPDKTRLVRFEPPRKDGGDDGPGTFDLLGFTHHWGLSRNGKWVVKKRTAKDRFSRALRRIGEWCRRHMHDPIPTQHQALSRKVRGHYAYYGVTSNSDALKRFHEVARTIWRRWLSRRSQSGHVTWDQMHKLLERFPLPPPRIVHRYGT